MRCGGETREVKARSAVIASGGFEANVPWLKEYWGDAAENFLIRGTKYNQGLMLKELLHHGAKPVGDPRGCHAVAIDARAPKFDGGIERQTVAAHAPVTARPPFFGSACLLG